MLFADSLRILLERGGLWMRGAGVLLYILLFGIISGGMWIVFNREHAEYDIKIYSLKSVLFFFAGFCFVVSAIKFYLGEAESTLSESFWDVEGRTYLHYGLVLALTAFIVLLLMKRLFSSVGYHLVHIFAFIYIIAIIIDWLLFGRIDNRSYCILYVICLMAAGIILFCHSKKMFEGCYHQQIEYIDKSAFRRRFLEALPFIGAWVVMTGVYFPNELYLYNSEEFVGNYGAFFLIMLAGSVVGIFLLIFVFLLFLPEKIYKVAYLFFAGISCAGYLQSMFLNGTLSVMNGEEQVWSGQKIFVNACTWIAILLISMIGGFCSSGVRKVFRFVCVYITLIQVATLGWLLITSDVIGQKENAAVTNKGSLELAQENNVIVFVLDNFDSSWFEEIYEDDAGILEPLADFTYYRNGTSQFAHTNNGIPCMLTGTEWNPDDMNYSDYAYKNSDALERIMEHGTDVRIFTDLELMSKELFQKMDNYSNTIVRRYKIVETYTTMLGTSMYKTAPFWVKPYYGYYTSDIGDITYNNDLWSIDNDLFFYRNIVENGLRISEEGSAFRFYHMRGPHAPFHLTEDLKYESTGRTATRISQGKGSLKIVYEYMEQMKALGVYEEAAIIITADHGQGNISDLNTGQGKPDKTSRPLFLVKNPGEYHENMEISEAPVSQAELIPTILKALDMEYLPYGRTFEEIPVNERRVRKYIDIYGNYNIEYVIDGHAADLESWSVGSAVYY